MQHIHAKDVAEDLTFDLSGNDIDRQVLETSQSYADSLAKESENRLQPLETIAGKLFANETQYVQNAIASIDSQLSLMEVYVITSVSV